MTTNVKEIIMGKVTVTMTMMVLIDVDDEYSLGSNTHYVLPNLLFHVRIT